MKPFGRKTIQIPNGKHHTKINGKHLIGWWENIVSLCKKRERQQVKVDIKRELEQ